MKKKMKVEKLWQEKKESICFSSYIYKEKLNFKCKINIYIYIIQ